MTAGKGAAGGGAAGGGVLWANAGLLLTSVFWGAVVPVLSNLLGRWDPYLLSLVRYGIAVPIFWALRWLLEPGPLLPPGIAPVRFVLSGGFIAGFVILYTLGIARSNPITAAVLSACSPLIAALVEWAGTRAPPQRALLFAIPLTVGGAVLGTVTPEAGVWGFGWGEALVVSGLACWSLYSFTARHWFPGCTPLRLALLTLTPCGAMLAGAFAAVAAVGLARPVPALTSRDLWELAWVSLGAVVIAFVLWNHGVRRLGVAQATLYMNLLPFMAMAAAVLYGILPTTAQVIGCVLVVAGIAQSQYFGNRETRLRGRSGG